MNCDELQLNLPLYADNVLSESERTAIDDHLPACPRCRQAISDFSLLRNDIRGLSVNQMPLELARSIKSTLHQHLDSRQVITVAIDGRSTFREKVLHWLMPYSIGTVTASVFTIAFLFVMMSEMQSSVNILEARGRQDDPILLANSNAADVRRDMQLPPEFGGVPIAASPPELNPAGALIALTKSIVRGNMKNEEVVIVADVFGSGLARIAEVVEPPSNDAAMRELEKAFNTDPASAPFKPSRLENDAERVRVVLKIQRVDVANTP